MGRELLDDEGIYEGDDRDQPQDYQDVRQDVRKSEEEAAQEKNLVEVLSKTVDHYFPKMNEWLGGLTDIRNQEMIEYERETIVWTGLISLVTKRQARVNISHEMRTEGLCKNLKSLCGQEDLKSVPHGDTVEYYCMRMKEEELERLQKYIQHKREDIELNFLMEALMIR